MNWKIIERPGHFGKEKDNLYEKWNSEFGEGNWRIAWQWGNRFLEKRDAQLIFEDAYFEFARKHPRLWFKLINTAEEIWDTAVSNIKSGINYDIQETPGEHVHDISIRRVNLRKGLEFKGRELIRIRKPTDNELSAIFGPYAIPFHIPSMISQEKIKDYTGFGEWWLNWEGKNSAEDFYQKNKLLIVRN